MSLAAFFQQNNFTSCSRIHLAPGIAPKLLSNALETFGFEGDPRDVVVLIDNTMFGSGKDGCLIGSDRIIFREPFSDAREFLFSEIKTIESKDSRVFLNGRNALKFNMPDKRDLEVAFRLLGQWLEGQVQGQVQEQAPLTLDVQPERVEQPPVDEPEITALEVVGAAADSKAKDKLFGFIATAVEQHKAKIIPLLKEKTGEASLAALRDDGNIEKLAAFLYAFLPGVVRLALKEDVFVQFVLANRNKVLERVLPPLLEDEPLLELAPAAPAKRLSSFAAPAAKAIEREPVAAPSFFRQKLQEGQAHLREFQAAAERASNAERNSEAFYQALQDGYLIELGVGVLDAALQMPEWVAQALGNDLSGNQLRALASDEATLETLGYAISSIGHMLREEAGYNDDQVLEFLSPLLLALVVPYIQQRLGEGRKTLRSVAKPMEQVVDSELMQGFQFNCRRLGMNLANSDQQSLCGNYTFSLYRAVQAQFDDEAEGLGLSSRLDTFARQGAPGFLSQLDQTLEALIIAFLENNQ